jgi:hypothetical protein
MNYTNEDAANEVKLLTERYDMTNELIIVIRSEIEHFALERKFTDTDWGRLSREVFHSAQMLITSFVSELRDNDEVELEKINKDEAAFLNYLKETKND